MNTAFRNTVGHFPSIPWIPYYVNADQWPVQLRQCESSGVRRLVERAQLDVTPMATADWFSLGNKWRRLSNLGIAFRGRAGSVLMFSNDPIDQMDEADIAVCDETTSSVRILQALLERKYGLRIGRWQRNVDVTEGNTPRLLIQNQAVEELNRKRFRYVYDLGREWWDWQGTPLVTAVWVHRADMDPMQVEAVEQLLRHSLAEYQRDPASAVTAAKARHGWALGAEEVQELHENFEYALGEESQRGIERMRALLPEHVQGFINAARELEPA